jgi:hypothetical protein
MSKLKMYPARGGMRSSFRSLGNKPCRRRIYPPNPLFGLCFSRQLPSGYACAAAGGLAYRRRVQDGAAVIEPLYQDGHLVHCSGNSKSVVLRGSLACSDSGYVMEMMGTPRMHLTNVRCTAVWKH